MQEIITREAAREAGLTKYFSGIPCPKGHLARRYVNCNSCVECRSEQRLARRLSKPEEVAQGKKMWQQKNAEHCRQYKKAWVASNREKVNHQAQASYWRNREKILERAKLYRNSNKERVLADHKRWRAEHKELANRLTTAWRARNKDVCLFHAQSRRARKQNADGRHTLQDVREIYARQKGRCAYCNKKVLNSYHVDHIQPLARGGSDHKDNLQICCAECNLRKHAKDPFVFANEIGLLL